MILIELRNRVEDGFRVWGRIVYERRWIVLVLSLALTGICGSLVPGLRFDNSSESYLRDDDPTKILYTEFRRQFGNDHHILIAVTPPEIFALSFLTRLRDFHEALETGLPHVEEITSLLNARDTRGDEDGLLVGELLESWPENEGDLRALRRRVLANPLFVDNLISRDGRVTTLTLKPVTYSDTRFRDELLQGFEEPASEVGDAAGAEDPAKDDEFLSAAEQRALVSALDELVERWDAPDFRIHAVGSILVAECVTGGMQRDLRRHVAAAILAVAVLLFVLFRRPSGVILPLILVFATLVTSLGIMVLLDLPFSITLGMLPVFIVTVGVCDAVHLLVIVYQRLGRGSTTEEAIGYAFRHSGLAILMTSVTTAAGLMSFLASTLAPTMHLGIVAPIAVMVAFLYTMTLLPALASILKLHGRPLAGGGEGKSLIERVLVRIGDSAAHHPWATLIPTLLICSIVLIGLGRIRLSHDPMSWLPEDMPIRIAAEYIDTQLRGSSTIEVIVDSGRENGLKDPGNLRRIEAAMRYAETLERDGVFIGKAISLVDIVKETHQALNENLPAYHVVPTDARLVAQELLLFENSGTDDLEDFTDTPFRSGRISMRVPMADGILYGPVLDELDRNFTEILGAGLTFQITGGTTVHARTFTEMITSMARSYVLALMVITPLMMFLIGSLRLGLVSMIPNLLPVLLTLALMGWLDIPLDPSNIVIGSIIIGLAVDDTIHFMHRFQGDFAVSGDLRGAVRSTLSTTGSALLFTSLVLIAGFIVLGSMGTMRNTVQFGYLAAFGIAIAFLADVIISPALIALVKAPRQPQRQ